VSRGGVYLLYLASVFATRVRKSTSPHAIKIAVPVPMTSLLVMELSLDVMTKEQM